MTPFEGRKHLYFANIMAEYLAHLLHIWKVPGSNLCLETGHPN
jgi:hypothetical protein